MHKQTTGQIRGQGEHYQNTNWPNMEHDKNYKPFIEYHKSRKWKYNTHNTAYVEGSIFRAYARKSECKKQIQLTQDEIKRKHPQACHVPYVWNAGNSVTKTDTDGEPICKYTNRSVCDKMLETLLKNGYEDVMLIIAREWDGNKLGLTKLQNAYANATKEIIHKYEQK